MDSLLNPATFDLGVLCNTVNVCMDARTAPDDRAQANHILTELKSNHEFCMKVPSIVENGEVPLNTKVYAMQVRYKFV